MQKYQQPGAAIVRPRLHPKAIFRPTLDVLLLRQNTTLGLSTFQLRLHIHYMCDWLLVLWFTSTWKRVSTIYRGKLGMCLAYSCGYICCRTVGNMLKRQLWQVFFNHKCSWPPLENINFLLQPYGESFLTNYEKFDWLKIKVNCSIYCSSVQFYHRRVPTEISL